MAILDGTSHAGDTVVVTISKWGNSLGLRIPRGLAEDAQLTEGAAVDIRLERGRIVVEPLKEDTLDQLLSRVTDENLHGDAFAAAPAGREAL